MGRNLQTTFSRGEDGEGHGRPFLSICDITGLQPCEMCIQRAQMPQSGYVVDINLSLEISTNKRCRNPCQTGFEQEFYQKRKEIRGASGTVRSACWISATSEGIK